MKKIISLYLFIAVAFSINIFGAAFPVNRGIVYQSTVTTTAQGTTTLVATSNQVQIAEGSEWQIYKLPNATLLPNDWSYEFNNNSAKYLTIQDNGGNNIASVNNGKIGRFFLKSNASANGTWKNYVMSAIALVSQVITDHGDLTGLSDDDHTQYHNDTRGDIRYYTKSQFINNTAGVADADKPIKTNAAGVIDGSFVPSSVSPLTTKGDIWGYSSSDARFPIASDNSILIADSAATFGFRWGMPQNYWSTTGNAGTTAGTNFLGTQDAIDLVFKTNNTEYFRITSAGLIDTTLSAGIATINSTGILTSVNQNTLMHRYLGDLTVGDDHTQYFLLSGRAGGQTANCGTGSGDDCVISSTSHATKGDLTFGQSYQEFSTSKVRLGAISVGAPATSMKLAFTSDASNPYMSFENSSGQRWILAPESSELQFNRQANDVVGFKLNTNSGFGTGDGAVTYMAGFSNGGSTVTDITSPTTGNVTPVVSIRNRNTTVNNYTGLVFQNQQSADVSGIFGINENHTAAGGQTGRIDLMTANAGTKGVAMSIAADKTVTMNKYGAGIATMNSTGVVATQTLTTILDGVFGQVRGNIIYRGASGWAALGPATANSVLVSGGTGADPSWRYGTTPQAISSTDIDWGTGNSFTKTLGANTTFTFSNMTAGQTIVVRLINTASNYTVTWPASVIWSGASAPVQTVGAKADVYTLWYDGLKVYGSYVQNFTP